MTSRSADAPRISRASVFARGLIEVGAAPTISMNLAGGAVQNVTPARLFGDVAVGEIAFSRWFSVK